MNPSFKFLQKCPVNFRLFCFGLIVCQIINSAYRHSAAINNSSFFGLAGNNVTAIIISIIVLITVIMLIRKQKHFGLSLIIVLAGAVSNLLNRFLYGGTLDYWNLWFIPTFNLADVFIIGGMIFYLYHKALTLRPA